MGNHGGGKDSRLLTSAYVFVPGAGLEPPPPSRCQRPEKLSKAVSLMSITAGDASHLLQMQAKNTEE